MAAFENNVHNVIAITFTVTVPCPTLQRGKVQGPSKAMLQQKLLLTAPVTISQRTPYVGHSDKMQQLVCTSLMQEN